MPARRSQIYISNNFTGSRPYPAIPNVEADPTPQITKEVLKRWSQSTGETSINAGDLADIVKRITFEPEENILSYILGALVNGELDGNIAPNGSISVDFPPSYGISSDNV